MVGSIECWMLSVWSWHSGWSLLAFGKRCWGPTGKAALCIRSLLPREACGGITCGWLLAVGLLWCTKTETAVGFNKKKILKKQVISSPVSWFIFCLLSWSLFGPNHDRIIVGLKDYLLLAGLGLSIPRGWSYWCLSQ